MNKSEIRAKLLAQRQACSAGEVSHRTKQIYDLFIKELYPKILKTRPTLGRVGFYYSIRGEVEIRPFYSFFKKNKVHCAFPKVANPREKKMEFRDIKSLAELTLGQWGIAEPSESHPIATELDVIFVPGVAFDLQKNRIGYGGGYYDRFIAELKNTGKRNSTLLVGLCYDFQLLERFEVAEADQKVDIVLTEDRII